MKVHLCCGDVYLNNYVNVDTVGTLVPQGFRGTTVENYYIGEVHDNKEVYVDLKCDLLNDWPFEDNVISEFLMVSAFEHFTLKEAEQLLKNIYTSLKFGGEFKFDFPDIERTVAEYKNSPNYMMRLIYGSHKNEFGGHKHGYTKQTIYDFLMRNRFSGVEFGDVVKHDYPMIGVTATK